MTMTMMVGTMVAKISAVDDGGNYDRDDFCDSDEGCNDRTGIVNDDGNDLQWWLL